MILWVKCLLQVEFVRFEISKAGSREVSMTSGSLAIAGIGMLGLKHNSLASKTATSNNIHFPGIYSILESTGMYMPLSISPLRPLLWLSPAPTPSPICSSWKG
jgi:hypothetical protein